MIAEAPTTPGEWRWKRTETDRIELGRDGGPTLFGEHTGRDGWRLGYRVEREGAVFVDALGNLSNRDDPRAVLAETARYIEDHDLPEEHAGELLAVEDGSIRCRRWRIQ
ncbi:hypothetical protein [Halalkalicoccus sp. NIPERK01]|uniref:hypothetical protein n=1 Tax=Halalkalicoccus sp. NIPERK01 TaxID=3053469 RepID=UPI00256F54E1|nr:hypothetical protein [Halalkalicoccus sp. NIPERK01]MDL5362226.1 hypothetical protein [Halalkalicoccus sp. NIPERK01]